MDLGSSVRREVETAGKAMAYWGLCSKLRRRQVVVYRDSRMAGLDLSMGKPSLPS